MSEQAAREARGVGVSMLTLLAQVSMPAFHVLLSRGLGRSGYGLYAWSNMLVEMLSVVTLLGMDIAVTRETSVAVNARDDRRVERAVAQGLRVVLLSGAAIAVAIAVGAPWIGAWSQKPGVVGPLRALVAVPVAYHAATMFLLATNARLVMQYDFWTRGIFQPLALLGATTLALHLHGGIVGACVAVALGMTATALLAGALYGRQFSLPATLREAAFAPTDRALLRLGLPFVAMNLVAALRGRIDAFWLLRYGTEADVGAYNACMLYAASLFQIRGAFYPVIAARLPALLDAGDRGALNEFLTRQVRWVALLATPVLVLFAGLGDGLLAVFGDGFVHARTALALLAVGQFVSALSLPVYTLPLGGNTRFSVFAACAAVGLQLVVPRALIPRYGLAGAAFSFMLALITAEVIALLFAWRKTGANGLSRGLVQPLAAGVAAFFAARAVQPLLPPHVAVRFFVGTAAGALTYVTLVVATGLQPVERALAARGVDAARKALSSLRARRAKDAPRGG